LRERSRPESQGLSQDHDGGEDLLNLAQQEKDELKEPETLLANLQEAINGLNIQFLPDHKADFIRTQLIKQMEEAKKAHEAAKAYRLEANCPCFSCCIS
jgi:hypothetical protein